MKAQVISFHCTLKDPMGRVISSSFNSDVLTQAIEGSLDKARLAPTPSLTGHTPYDEPLKGLLEGLQGLKKGEKRRILVSADRAYGFYDPSLVIEVARKKLPRGDALEIGYQVITQADDGESRIFRVTSADAQTVTLDGNHPLAGQDLCFDIEATSTREATQEEIAQASLAPRDPLIH